MIKPAINKFFEFPETVNEVSARFVAAGVFTLSFVALISIQLDSNLGPILNIILIIGFLAYRMIHISVLRVVGFM